MSVNGVIDDGQDGSRRWEERNRRRGSLQLRKNEARCQSIILERKRWDDNHWSTIKGQQGGNRQRISCWSSHYSSRRKSFTSFVVFDGLPCVSRSDNKTLPPVGDTLYQLVLSLWTASISPTVVPRCMKQSVQEKFMIRRFWLNIFPHHWNNGKVR